MYGNVTNIQDMVLQVNCGAAKDDKAKSVKSPRRGKSPHPLGFLPQEEWDAAGDYQIDHKVGRHGYPTIAFVYGLLLADQHSFYIHTHTGLARSITYSRGHYGRI